MNEIAARWPSDKKQAINNWLERDLKERLNGQIETSIVRDMNAPVLPCKTYNLPPPPVDGLKMERSLADLQLLRIQYERRREYLEHCRFLNRPMNVDKNRVTKTSPANHNFRKAEVSNLINKVVPSPQKSHAQQYASLQTAQRGGQIPQQFHEANHINQGYPVAAPQLLAQLPQLPQLPQIPSCGFVSPSAVSKTPLNSSPGSALNQHSPQLATKISQSASLQYFFSIYPSQDHFASRPAQLSRYAQHAPAAPHVQPPHQAQPSLMVQPATQPSQQSSQYSFSPNTVLVNGPRSSYFQSPVLGHLDIPPTTLSRPLSHHTQPCFNFPDAPLAYDSSWNDYHDPTADVLDRGESPTCESSQVLSHTVANYATPATSPSALGQHPSIQIVACSPQPLIKSPSSASLQTPQVQYLKNIGDSTIYGAPAPAAVV